MHSRRYDVLVVGEGMAGTIAALAAAHAGASVALVSKGPGSFVSADDCVDFEGLTPERVGSGEFTLAVQFFREIAAAAGCEYRGRLGETVPVPTILGSFRYVTFAPLYFGDRDPRQAKKVVVVGFPSIRDFDADFIAERLASKAQAEGRQANYTAQQLAIASPIAPPRLEIEFAAQFERNPQFRQAVLAALASAAAQADLLIIPAVLGTSTSTEELRQMWRQVGCPICEVASMPPSVLGMRLLRRLERHLATMEIELLSGFAVSKLCLSGNACRGVFLDTPGRQRQISAEAVVLAIGAFSHLFSLGEGMADNIRLCGGALKLSDPRTENAVAIVTGFHAGTSAANLGVRHA